MGTKGTIHFKDGRTTLLSIRSQFDSYPYALGSYIKDFTSNGRGVVVSALEVGKDSPEYFLGMGDVAAYVLSQLCAVQKRVTGFSIGSIFVTTKADRQEFNYFITASESGQLMLRVLDSAEAVLYDGPLEDFEPEAVQSSLDGGAA